MPSSSRASGVLTYRSLFGEQRREIITSIIIHIVVLFLLFWTSVTTKTSVIAQAQIIQASLVYEKPLSGDGPEKKKQTATVQVSPVQNKISHKEPEKPVTMQKEIFREQVVSDRQNTTKPDMYTEMPVVETSRNLGSSYGKDTQQITVSSVANVEGSGIAGSGFGGIHGASKTESSGSGIGETEFGGMHGPSFVHRAVPVYPMLARRLGKEGKVLLRLLIDKDGKLQNVEVIESAGFGLTEAAIAAVKNSTYAPAGRNGEKITTQALLPVRFYLQ